MKSKRSLEGYLLIDHRNSPGIPDWMARRAGIPAKGLFEAAIITCAHCQTGVVLNPQRTRERAYCAKCDRYLCDTCGAIMGQTKECRSMARRLDELQERVALAQQRGTIALSG